MVITSIHPERPVPAGLDLWDLLIENTQREYPDDHVLFVQTETDEKFTYAELKTAATQFGASLHRSWGWEEEDVIAILAPSIIEIPVIVFGALWANGVPTIVNAASTKEQLIFQLKDSGAKAIVVVPGLLEAALEAASEVGIAPSRVLLFGQRGFEGHPTWKEFSSEKASEVVQRPKRNKSLTTALATLPYTSGTTGTSKGVRLTHANIIHNIIQFSEFEGAGPLGWKWQSDKLLSVLPWFHQYGIFTVFAVGVFAGVQVIVLEKFDFVKMLQAIPKYKITYLTIVPPIFAALAAHPVIDAFNLSSIRLLYSAGSFLEQRISNAVTQRLTKQGGKPVIRQGYGMTEACPVIASQRYDDFDTDTHTTCGYLLPGITAKFVDIHKDTEITTPDTLGRLLIKGPNIFPGYHNLENLNASLFDADGYFDTGDLAVFNSTGAITIKGREGEAVKVKSKGLIILPGEIEGVLAGHPDIADGVVVAVDGETPGDQVARAFVILKEGVEKTSEVETSIKEHVAQKAEESAKHLNGGVRFVGAIPRTPAGKVLRRILAAA
ncbi:hypothetical protein DFH27DRAFT_633340 [Peziza echinospora]|nr:hypothetical protein DFH27DRAFT_633340 [Peziza echinospora]